MNYFLENHVAEILKKPLILNSKRAVTDYILSKLLQVSKHKYINLLNSFEQEIIDQNISF